MKSLRITDDRRALAVNPVSNSLLEHDVRIHWKPHDSHTAMRFFLVFVLALALLAPSTGWAQIKKETSEVTGTMRLVSTEMRSLVTDSYPGHASFRAAYEASNTDTTWTLSFYGFAEAATDMSAATQVRVQADGRPVSTQDVRSNTRSMDDSILEIKHATFTRSNFQRLATADRVAATIGSHQFELTKPLRKDLRLILERLPNRKGPSTASTEDSESNR
ncbi:hypothetical protein BSZ35_11185 [Salinibacter sp. 10B]|nr:hypothetical protein BSZ35_11185 [Salinibacter sp. 10B]